MILILYLLISIPLFYNLLGISAFTIFNFINTVLSIIIRDPDLIYFTLCCSLSIFFSIHSYWHVDRNSLKDSYKWAPNSNKYIFYIGHTITHILPAIILLSINTLHTKSNRTLLLTILAIIYQLYWAYYVNESIYLNEIYHLNSSKTTWNIGWSTSFVGHILYYCLSKKNN